MTYFREIRTGDKITDKNQTSLNYLNIKPKKRMTKKEAEEFWAKEIEKERQETLKNINTDIRLWKELG